MRKFGKVSLLMLALSTAAVGGNFYLSNLAHEIDKNTSLTKSYSTRLDSDKVYLNINNVLFQEDLKVKVKYTIQRSTGEIVDEQFVHETMYGTEFVVMQKGDTDIGGSGEVERIAFEADTLVPDEGGDSSGTATSEPIQLTNNLYELGQSYDAYIVWHEFNEDGSLNNTDWFQTTPSTFTFPVSTFPSYSLKKEHEGANQALVSFNVAYDESLDPAVIGENNVKYFFNILRLNWEDNVGPHTMDVSEVIHDDITHNENVWLDWDPSNHMFSYYLLIDNLASTYHDVTYQFTYNSQHFGTNQAVDNLDDPLKVKAGNKYVNLPVINYTYEVPEDPTTLADYQKVDLKFSVSENEIWKDEYNTVMTELGYDFNDFELKPINSMDTIVIDNIVSESGETPTGTTRYETEKINQYNEELSAVTVTGLEAGTTYTADATLNLDEDIFSKDSVVLPIQFSTLDTIDQPTLTYVGDEDLDASDFTNWSRDVLKFNLEPGSWTFNSDLILPGDLFSVGEIEFYNNGTLESTAAVTGSILSKLVEGENSLDTAALGVNLKAATSYTFKLNLEYSSYAQGLIDTEYYPTINGSFTTKEQIAPPKLRFTGSDLVTDDKSAIDLRFDIVDDSGSFSGVGDDVLTLKSTFDELKITDFHKVTEDGDLVEGSNIDFTDSIPADELLLESEGENVIRVEGLEGDSTYEFTAALTYDATANNQDPDGWIPFDEDGEISITKRVSTDSKYEAFNVDVTEISTTKNEGKPTWSSVVEIRVPTGDESVSGINTPNADVSVSYELFDYATSSVIKRDTIGAADWQTDMINEESYVQLQFDNLSASNTYKVSTITSFNNSVMVDVNDDELLINTGKNDGFTNDMLNAQWGIRDQSTVEKYNYYSDLYIAINVDADAASNQGYLDGYQSMQLLDPYGAIIDTNDDTILTTDSKPMLWLEGSFAPGETLEGYKVKIINDELTEDSGLELELPSLYLPKLLEPTVKTKSMNPTSTSVDVELTFDNYNNVDYAECQISSVDTGNVLWTGSNSAGDFIGEDSGSKDIALNIPEGILEPQKDYLLTVETHFKDFVDSTETSNVTTFGFSSSIKTEVITSIDTDANTNSIRLNYAWEGNDSNSNKLEKFTARILSPEDGYSNILTTEQSVNTVGVSGNGTIDFTDLDSGIEYKVEVDSYYEDIATPINSVFYITTEQKTNTFNSSFDLNQKSENSIELVYRYQGLNKVEDDIYSAVSSLHFSLYNGDLAQGIPIYEYEVDLSTLQEDGSKTVIFEDEDLIKPGNKYTLEESITYDSFSGWTANDGTGEPVYDVERNSKTVSVFYDNSIVNSSIEFVNSNTLAIQITIEDPAEFKNGGNLIVSLVSGGKAVSFVNDNAIFTIEDEVVDYYDLDPYLSPDSTSDKYIFDIEINGVYVEEGKTVELDAVYSDEYCGSSTKQTHKQLLNPNSIKSLARYEYSSSYDIYELYIDADDSVDLSEDISFTKKNSTEIQSNEVMAVDETILGDILEYNPDHLYIKVKSTGKPDFRDLSFMVGRYIVVDNNAKSLIDFNIQSAYFITGFETIPMPKVPLTPFQIILIILLVILLILIIWLIIYSTIKYYRKEKWYEYALKKANAYYYMHRKNMNMYGWSHKFSEYESLNDMTIPELKEYAKKINLPIPYGLSKRELVDTLSLLNETELTRIKDYSNYQIEIPEKVRNDLLDEFQVDPKESRWMKKRFKYTIDRAQRMQKEDYKKSFSDLLVDFYIVFDKVFVKFTDSILRLFKLKKVEVKKVKVEDHEWDDHKNSNDIEEGISEIEIDNASKGGDEND